MKSLILKCRETQAIPQLHPTSAVFSIWYYEQTTYWGSAFIKMLHFKEDLLFPASRSLVGAVDPSRSGWVTVGVSTQPRRTQ